MAHEPEKAAVAADFFSIRTSLLNIHYADMGPKDGKPVFLLHGWPDSPHTWLPMARVLNQAGFRTVMPYLRGFGSTRYLSEATLRSAQPTALAQDVLDLADGLGIERFSVVGHDWGARAAYVLAAQEPLRIARCVAISVGYGAPALTYRQARYFWYQWYFSTPQGEAALASDRRSLCRYLWQQWSPNWAIPQQDFDEAAQAFDNPDWLDTTLHTYRYRWGLAPADPHYAQQESRQATTPHIHTPTLLIHGEADGCIDPQSSEGLDEHFTRYERIVLPGIGHFPQREAAAETNALVWQWLREGSIASDYVVSRHKKEFSA